MTYSTAYLMEREHAAWVHAAQSLRRIGFDLNDVDVETFEPARVALCHWALAYAAGHRAGVFKLDATHDDAHAEPTSTGNEPIATTYAVVAATLRNMAALVEERDSDEGSIEYLLPEPPEWSRRGEPEPEGWVDDEVLMRATYRMGNRDGQGWVRIFGSINDGTS